MSDNALIPRKQFEVLSFSVQNFRAKFFKSFSFESKKDGEKFEKTQTLQTDKTVHKTNKIYKILEFL